MKNLFKKKSLKIEKLIKKTLNFDEKTDIKRIKVSKTNSECGVFHKGEHKKVFAYSAKTACDKNNFVLGFVLTPGNYHDSSSFAEIYQQVITSYPNISTIVADSGYRTPAIAKLIIDDNRTPIFPYKRPMTKDGFF
ncbi:transposase [Cetobacterium sp.]|uniref:transposase n=1 Tax=Cetobacterium sp. TaxID=2071632 RepID=UPI003AF01674